MELCARCGLDLNSLGQYKGFMHYDMRYKPMRIPCVDIPPHIAKLIEKQVEKQSKTLARRLNETLLTLIEE